MNVQCRSQRRSVFIDWKPTVALPGASIEAETMPSHALIAKYHDLKESEDFCGIPWHELRREMLRLGMGVRRKSSSERMRMVS